MSLYALNGAFEEPSACLEINVSLTCSVSRNLAVADLVWCFVSMDHRRVWVRLGSPCRKVASEGKNCELSSTQSPQNIFSCVVDALAAARFVAITRKDDHSGLG